eukprot:1959638-Pyramimonas_sp.AAC.3
MDLTRSCWDYEFAMGTRNEKSRRTFVKPRRSGLKRGLTVFLRCIATHNSHRSGTGALVGEGERATLGHKGPPRCECNRRFAGARGRAAAERTRSYAERGVHGCHGGHGAVKSVDVSDSAMNTS